MSVLLTLLLLCSAAIACVVVAFALFVWLETPPNLHGEGGACDKDQDCLHPLVCSGKSCLLPCACNPPDCDTRGERAAACKDYFDDGVCGSTNTCWRQPWGATCGPRAVAPDVACKDSDGNVCELPLWAEGVSSDTGVAGCCQSKSWKGGRSPYCREQPWVRWGAFCGAGENKDSCIGGACESGLYTRNAQTKGCCQPVAYKGAPSLYCRAESWRRDE